MKRLLIDDLIQKPREVTLDIGDRKVTMWIRSSRDPERTMATANARKASRTLRKLLEDPKTEQYQLLIKDELDEADKNSLRRVWVNGKLIPRALEIRQQSLEEREYVPSPLDNEEGVATPKDMDHYEDRVEEVEEEREMNVLKAINTARRQLEEESEKIKEKDLYKAAIPPLIESQCAQAYEVEYTAQLILRCTFSDKKCTTHVFDNIEEVYSLRPDVLERLTREHMALMLDPEAVKN